jgi:uncharacterized protein (TIGR02118 family)
MIVLLGFYRRRPDLSWEQFSDHWRNVHGPLLRDTPATASRIRRYVQHHLRPNPDHPEAALPYDGFSEVWFDSVDDRKAMHGDPVYQALMPADEALFLDLSATRLHMIDMPVVQIGEETRVNGETVRFIG